MSTVPPSCLQTRGGFPPAPCTSTFAGEAEKKPCFADDSDGDCNVPCELGERPSVRQLAVFLDGMGFEHVENMSQNHIENIEEEKEKDDEVTDTDLSQGLFYKEVTNFVLNSIDRRIKRRTTGKQKRKRAIGCENDAIPRAYSRCSLSYFSEVMKSILKCPHKVQLVNEFGFQELLEFDDCNVPRAFVQWITDMATFEGDEIFIGGKSVKMNYEAVHQTVGIPCGGLTVDCDEEGGKLAFLAQFALTDLPSIKFFWKHDHE